MYFFLFCFSLYFVFYCPHIKHETFSIPYDRKVRGGERIDSYRNIAMRFISALHTYMYIYVYIYKKRQIILRLKELLKSLKTELQSCVYASRNITKVIGCLIYCLFITVWRSGNPLNLSITDINLFNLAISF